MCKYSWVRRLRNCAAKDLAKSTKNWYCAVGVTLNLSKKKPCACHFYFKFFSSPFSHKREIFKSGNISLKLVLKHKKIGTNFKVFELWTLDISGLSSHFLRMIAVLKYYFSIVINDTLSYGIRRYNKLFLPSQKTFLFSLF